MAQPSSTQARNQMIKDRVYTLALALYLSGAPQVRKLAKKFIKTDRTFANSRLLHSLLNSSDSEIRETIEAAVSEQKDIEQFRTRFFAK